MSDILREIIEERIRYWREVDDRAEGRYTLETDRGAMWRVMELAYILDVLLPEREGSNKPVDEQ